MRLEVLGCSGGLGRGARLTAFAIDGRLILDAGHLATLRPTAPEALVLSHAHLDHLLHLPMLLTSRILKDCATLTVAGERETLRRLREGLMGGEVYPDHHDQPTASGAPVACYRTVDEQPFSLAGYRLQPLRMTHPLPCLAFAVRAEAGGAGALIGGDTSDSAPLWRFAAAERWVQLVVVEVSFPDGYEQLALDSGHLTPSMLAEQMRGFRRRIPIVITHIKPEARRPVMRQLRERLGDRVIVARNGQRFDVGD